MLKTRIGLTNAAGSALAKGCVIAARYSAVRLQGFQVGSAGIMNSEECQILDYQNQLFRVLQVSLFLSPSVKILKKGKGKEGRRRRRRNLCGDSSHTFF